MEMWDEPGLVKTLPASFPDVLRMAHACGGGGVRGRRSSFLRLLPLLPLPVISPPASSPSSLAFCLLHGPQGGQRAGEPCPAGFAGSPQPPFWKAACRSGDLGAGVSPEPGPEPPSPQCGSLGLCRSLEPYLYLRSPFPWEKPLCPRSL